MEVVILAAGKGTRMNSSIPKVLHSIGGKAMLAHAIDAAIELEGNLIHVVVGYGAKKIEDYCEEYLPDAPLSFVVQSEQLGTGHAVQQAIPSLTSVDDTNTVLVLYGDVPLIQAQTLENLLTKASIDSVAILTAFSEDPTGLGRIIRNEQGDISAIVEEKDATEAQKAIKEFNTGIMALPAGKLAGWLECLSNDNSQGEYYLTDVVEMAVEDGCSVESLPLLDEIEAQGVNDKIQLALLERYYQNRIAGYLLSSGVTIRDPNRLDIRGEIAYGTDVEIDINVVLEGTVRIGNNVKIGPNVVIKDSVINDDVEILAGSNIDGAEISAGCKIGPTARLRPGTKLARNVKIGNFVEIKNSHFGEGSKANHLAYIGDATIGSGVNIGAGTIFCNYDGVNKHASTVGDNCFIGSNSVIIAPVDIEKNSFIAAGSAINRNVDENQLSISRGKQRNIDGWKRPAKKP
ncbi:MAG: bifunctional UDP-N-acetylglucosamine diphosphorylase/glucosamine-1-phosphate N-acetyltransferase GlmU [Pseudohongiellaceae bacterium]